MSDELPVTREGIAEAITAGLDSMGQADSTPPPAPEVAAAADEAPASPTPEPVVEVAPAPEAPAKLSLTDTSIVIDPADGTEKTWGEIKAERLRHADYTKKRMADAEKVRTLEANEARRQAAFEAWQAKQTAASAPDLPDDDPYAIRIKAVEAQAKYLAEVDSQRQQAHEEAMKAAQIKESQVALKAVEQRLKDEYGFKPREIEAVESEYYRRGKAGETVTIDSIAKEHKAYLAALKEEAVKEFKDKHRVGTPAATVTVPAIPENQPPKYGTPGFYEAFRESAAGLMK